MTREEIDILWQKALHDSVKDGEQFTRYHFARAIADLQKEKDAKICEWVDDNTTECTEMATYCADAIRSPETDLDEALRRQ